MIVLAATLLLITFPEAQIAALAEARDAFGQKSQPDDGTKHPSNDPHHFIGDWPHHAHSTQLFPAGMGNVRIVVTTWALGESKTAGWLSYQSKAVNTRKYEWFVPLERIASGDHPSPPGTLNRWLASRGFQAKVKTSNKAVRLLSQEGPYARYDFDREGGLLTGVFVGTDGRETGEVSTETSSGESPFWPTTLKPYPITKQEREWIRSRK